MDGFFVSNYTIELTHDYTREYVDYVCRLCDFRSKTLSEKNDNYSYERMKYCFDVGRFAHGFYIIKCKGVVVCTGGVDDFKGWAVGTRYLRHNNDTNNLLPLRWFLGTIIHEHLDKKIIGFCTTQNLDQRNVIGLNEKMQERTKRRAEQYGPDSIFAAAIDVNNNTKKMNFPILYRNTVQEVYTYYTDKIPPFERV